MLSIIFILLLENKKYIGWFWGRLIINFILSIYFVKIIISYFKFTFNFKHVKYILIFSVALIPYTLSGVILAHFDRIMIYQYTNASDAGLYSMAYNIGMLLLIFFSALKLAWVPKFFEYIKKKQYNNHDSDIDKIFRLTIIAASILILFGKDLGIFLVAEKFHSAFNIIPIIVIGYVFFSIFEIYHHQIIYAKKSILSSIIALLSCAINIILNAIYIPKYGYTAGAYTTVISYLIMALLTWLVVKFYLNMHVTPLIIIMKPFFMLILFVGFYYAISIFNINFVLSILIKIILSFLLGVLLFRKDLSSLIYKLKK